MLVMNVTAKQYKSNKSRFTNSQNMMIWSILVTSVTTKQHTWTHWTFIHNKNTKEFSLIVTNLATRQPGKRYWKNKSNPNMRGSSTSVTSVTTNHRFSNNLRLFTKLCHFVPFFQKNPFDKVGYYLRNENDKFLFFWTI